MVDISQLPDSTIVAITIGDLREAQRLGCRDIYLTEREACDYLKCSRDTLGRMEKQGYIRHYALPTGAKRYRQSDVVQLIRPAED